jgi:DNA-binding CsgD family transcriptional regulator
MAVTLSTADDQAALRRALAVLEQLGAKPAANYARNRLRAIGITSLPRGPRQSTIANSAGLTVREQDVLILAAAGLRNQEIARRLFLSEKTVERHLGSAFRKLNVGSRSEAVRVAADLGALSNLRARTP